MKTINAIDSSAISSERKETGLTPNLLEAGRFCARADCAGCWIPVGLNHIRDEASEPDG